MKQSFLFLSLLIGMVGYAQKTYWELTATRTGDCYLDGATNTIGYRNVHNSDRSLVLDYMLSEHGRITVSSSEYYNLVVLRRTKDDFRLFDAKDNNGNAKGVMLVYEWSESGSSIERCEIYIFDPNGDGVLL